MPNTKHDKIKVKYKVPVGEFDWFLYDSDEEEEEGAVYLSDCLSECRSRNPSCKGRILLSNTEMHAPYTADRTESVLIELFSMRCCIVLNCIVLFCIILYYIILYCIVLYCIVLNCVVLNCIVLY